MATNMEIYSNYTFSQLVRHIELLENKSKEFSPDKYIQILITLSRIPLSEKVINLLSGRFADCIYCNTVSNNFDIGCNVNKSETDSKLFLFNNITTNTVDVICKTCIMEKSSEHKKIELY